MNREIKFRGRNYDGVWMYGYLMPAPKPQIHPNCKHIISAVPHTMKSVDRGLYEVDPGTVGQYTGLKDKNGVEIYEGDIIMSSATTGEPIYHEVFYNEEEASFYAGLDGRRDTLFGIGSLYKRWIDEFGKEVVGNIHDNPELLNQEEPK